ncbi:MAG: hypothetical protein R6W77_00715 [Trueperaceae bacterium]
MALISALSLFDVLLRLVVGAVVAGLAGAVAAWTANRLGDDGPLHDGRATLNPLRHLDVLGLVAAVVFRVTWPSPVDVDPQRMALRSWRALLVPVATAAVLVAVGVAALVARPLALRWLADQVGLGVASALATFFHIASRSAVVSLLPFPGMPGAVLLAVLWPRAAAWGRSGTVRALTAVLVLLLLGLGIGTNLLAAVTSSIAAMLGYTVP